MPGQPPIPPVEPRSPGEGAPDGAATHPAAMCTGAGHVVVHGNRAFREVFGDQCVGLPAREGLVGLPGVGFAILDAVLHRGRPAARWIRMGGVEWRMIAAPRREPGTGETYGVSFHLRRRDEIDPGPDMPGEDEPGGGGAEA